METNGSNEVSRIELSDTGMDMIVKMSEGNPGAIMAMMGLLNDTSRIDPDAMLGGIGSVMALDTHEIYGTDIYILWSDKCGKDTRKMLMIMRAVQLGFMPEARLQEISADQTRQIDLSDEEWDEMDAKVCERLDEFEKPTTH